MNRRSLLLRCLVAGFVSCFVPTLSGAPANRPPNVLLIVSDDHQHTALGAAGNPIIQTPNLDRLAREGIRFTHAFVSLPICTPSRAAFLTGRFGASNGVTFFGQSIHENIATWPAVMAERGYLTAFTGKWHNVRGPDDYGFQWTQNMFMHGMGNYTDPPLTQRPGEKAKPAKGNITELFTDAAVRFLTEYDGAQPFFLYVAYTAPHDPRTPPPAYEKMYEPDRMVLPPNFMPRPPFDPGTLGIRDERLLPLPRDPVAVQREIGRYYGLITHMDAQIGRILDALDRTRLARDTIVIFAGDHGLTLGAHGLLGKQTMYEEGVRAPLIIRHPRLKQQGVTRDALVYLLDLMPTVCAWTDTPIPAGLDGRSLAAVCTGEQARVRDAVFGRYDEGDDPRFRMVRTERYKLIRYLKLKREELFDLQADPFERNDLSQDPKLEEVRRDLRNRLDRWQQGP